jgi:hypothetical protein
MLLPLASPGRDHNLVQWCVHQMATYYPGAPARNPPTGFQSQAATGGINFAAFGTSLSSGLSTGLAAAILAAQQLAQPLQAASTKTDWTQIQKDQILKIMGHPKNADFAWLAPPVWQEIVSEGKTANAVERVLKN